jgi:tetratricopeptide (TPR) repeat protein
VAAYLAGVQERARQAERERAAAEARAEEAKATARAERRAKRRAVALAGSVLVLVSLAGGGLWGLVHWRGTTDRRINLALNEATELRARAALAPPGGPGLALWGEAEAAGRRLDDLLAQGLPSAELRRQVRDWCAAVGEEAARARRQAAEAQWDHRFLDRLAEVRSQKEDEFDRADTDGDYAQAFREFGLEVAAPAAVAERLRPRPEEVRREVAAALDDWALLRRRSGRAWPGLLALARAIDPDDPVRNALRGLDRTDRARERAKLAELARVAQVDQLPAASAQLLGMALREAGEVERAAALLKEAQLRHPRDAWLSYELARTFQAHKPPRWDEAIRYYEAARAVRPEVGHALGHALEKRGQAGDAAALFAELTRLRPANPRHHNCLGIALRATGRLEEAIAEHRRAIELDPEYALAHGALGQALLAQGRFREAQAATRRCLDMLPQGHPLRAYVIRQLQRCEHMLALEGRLPAVLRGQDRPADAAECLQFAELCRTTKRPAAAARLSADALAATAPSAERLKAGHRYNAACSAALAAAGRGEDAGRLPAKARAGLRRQALGWLRADLAAWGELAGDPKARPQVVTALRPWRDDPDLAGVRDPEALARLPDAERAAWQRLWADAADLLKRAKGGP